MRGVREHVDWLNRGYPVAVRRDEREGLILGAVEPLLPVLRVDVHEPARIGDGALHDRKAETGTTRTS